MKTSLILLLSLFVLCASLALAKKDPELEKCKQQCRAQMQYSLEEKRECERRCEDYYKEKKEGEPGDESWGTTSSEERLRECQKQCDRREGGSWGQEKALCRLRCQERYKGEQAEEKEEEETRGGRDDNPYVFEHEHFTERVKTQHGRIVVLQRFAKKSKLLSGLENSRVAILEANPQTFIAPAYLDADALLFVAKGRGTISIINEDNKRESFNVERGDAIKIRAGTSFYLINRDDNEKLDLLAFVRPVNLPGKYESFRFPTGDEGKMPFSWELLEAAFKTDRRRIQRVFRQEQDVIVTASKEQIEALSQDEEQGGGAWPFGGESRRAPFNLLHKRPTRSNNYGQLFEARPDDQKEHLLDLNLMISFANITRGSMVGPIYNSRATKISIVVEGEGYMEMACPHVSRGSRQKEKSKGVSYEKISTRLSPGKVFVVPPGHPVAAVASSKSNLKIFCFEVNALGNARYTLAGKNNIVQQWEKEAKELTFGVSEREVDQVFGGNHEELFYPGPREQPWEGRADA